MAKITKDSNKKLTLSSLRWRWEYFLVLLIIAEFIIFGGLNQRFLNPVVLLSSINNFIPVCVVSLFVTYVIITGGMDIQAGSIIGLTSICVGVFWQKMGINIWVAVVLGLAVGALCGLFSGFLIAHTKVQPMVITLGGSFLFSGLALVVPSVAGVVSYQGITNFPKEFQAVSNGELFGIPNQVIIFLLLTIASYVLLHMSKYGRKVFLIGVNRNTAEYSGIKSSRIILSTYVLSVISASIAGILLTSYLGTAKPDLGADLTLPIITAIVLGGTSIYGGKGNVLGTGLAALIIGFMKFGLTLVGINAQYQDIPVGILLIVSLIINFMIKENIFKKLLKK